MLPTEISFSAASIPLISNCIMCLHCKDVLVNLETIHLHIDSRFSLDEAEVLVNEMPKTLDKMVVWVETGTCTDRDYLTLMVNRFMQLLKTHAVMTVLSISCTATIGEPMEYWKPGPNFSIGLKVLRLDVTISGYSSLFSLMKRLPGCNLENCLPTGHSVQLFNSRVDAFVCSKDDNRVSLGQFTILA